jgi:hypothetical protein
MSSEIRTVGNVPPIRFDRVAIVFDPGSGEILHHHRVTVTRRDADDLGEGEMRERAMLAAANFVAEDRLASAEVLTMSPEELEQARVEAETGMQELRVGGGGKGLICVPQERASD